MWAGGDYSLFNLRVWFPETAQILPKKRHGWHLKAILKAEVVADTGGDEKLTSKFVWPNIESMSHRE